MTSLRSLPRRSSGNSRLALTLAATLSLGTGLLAPAPALAAPAAAASLVQETPGGVTIDWQDGTLSAGAGAAADLRMPSVDVARPGAVRRAQVAALAKLRDALAALPLGAGRKLAEDEISRALGRARVARVDYQSNGGALIRVDVRFGDWLETPQSPPPAAPRGRADAAAAGATPALTLSVPAMPLGAAPTVRLGGKDLRIGAAVYRAGGAPAGTKALSARADARGRLVLPAEAGPATDGIAGGVAVIYVHKVAR